MLPHELITINNPLTAHPYPRGRSAHAHTLEEIVVNRHVVGSRTDGTVDARVEEQNIGVGADSERAFARVESKQLGRIGRSQFDVSIERDPPLSHTDLMEDHHPILDGRNPGRDMLKTAPPQGLLSVKAEGAVVC